MAADPRTPVPGGVRTRLKAGDGVAYILPILHWGSNYSTKMRRTVHGGFARLTHWDDTRWMEHLSPAAAGDLQPLAAALPEIRRFGGSGLPRRPRPGRGGLPRRPRRAAPRPRRQGGRQVRHLPEQDGAPHLQPAQPRPGGNSRKPEKTRMQMVHPMTLQWGLAAGRALHPGGGAPAVAAVRAGRRSQAGGGGDRPARPSRDGRPATCSRRGRRR